jgi:Gas vesicle synthesis protein GvpL/GvpF
MAEFLWVYGIVPGRHPGVDVAGLEGRPVEPIRHGELAALTSRVPADTYTDEALRRRLEDMDTVETMARAHDAVLDAALRAGDVLPLRMCTLYATPAAVGEMLAAEADHFAATLARLAGKAEWGVKAFLKPPGELAPAGRPASGTEYLARRRAQREQAAASSEAVEAAAAEVHARLADAARAAVMARLQDRRLTGRAEEMVLNGAYLVDHDGAERFAAGVEALKADYAEQGLELELTGPWPAYNFIGEPQAWR